MPEVDQSNARTKVLSRTAIARRAPSAPARWLKAQGRLTGLVLDFGCGRGADVQAYGLIGYDPYYLPVFPRKHYFDTVICLYVLNVVNEEEQADIITTIQELLKPGGKAYFAVRRNLPGTVYLKGYAQRLVFLPLPFVSIVRNSDFELYELSTAK